MGPGAWRFARISRYDGALRGGLGRTAPAEVLPGYGPRNGDFCRLMLHLLAQPNGPAEGPDPSLRESLFGLCTGRRPARAVAGSDAEEWEPTGRQLGAPNSTRATEAHPG